MEDARKQAKPLGNRTRAGDRGAGWSYAHVPTVKGGERAMAKNMQRTGEASRRKRTLGGGGKEGSRGRKKTGAS